MASIFREPLLQFFLVGAVVFGLFAIFDDTPPPPAAMAIEITADDARRLVGEFEATWRRPPQPDELDRLIEELVREEVYVREATALGLDQDDAVVRQRLRLKMEFLTEAGAQAIEPDEATLEAHLAANPEQFSRAPLVAFEQILLEERTGDAAIAEILASLNRGSDPGQAARPSLLPPALRASPPRVVDGTFGAGFFDKLAAMPVGDWHGPVVASYGQHLVRVTEQDAGGVPALAEVRERVLQDYRATFGLELREARFDAMRSRYEILRPAAEDVLTQ